jgi:hypothetical protein
MEFIIIGIVTALNVLFIKKKFDLKRYEDGFFDLVLLVTITIVFSGSYGALVVGMVASLIISIAFYANPPKFISPLASKAIDEFNKVKKQEQDRRSKQIRRPRR